MPRFVSSLPFFLYNVYIMGACILMGDDIYSGMYVCGCTHMCLCARVFMFICKYSVVCYSVSDSFGEIRTVAGDPDPIQIRARCGPDT